MYHLITDISFRTDEITIIYAYIFHPATIYVQTILEQITLILERPKIIKLYPLDTTALLCSFL